MLFRRLAITVVLLAAPCQAFWGSKDKDEIDYSIEKIPDEPPASSISYGVDVSFPIHHKKASNNYDYLPHNVDPENNPVPQEYKDMPVQPLGDRQA